MLIRRSKKKPSAMVWFFLCIAICLTCLLSPSLLTAGNNFTGDHSSTLQGDRSVSSEYPDFIHETLAREQNPFLLSHSAATQRVPLRLPVPHVWISYVMLLFSGLGILQKKRLKNRNENGSSRDYIIRYIHNQDGETYRPFFLT